jgi:predicted RNase H-like nuclease (RuvC/YqgF family)
MREKQINTLNKQLYEERAGTFQLKQRLEEMERSFELMGENFAGQAGGERWQQKEPNSTEVSSNVQRQ